MDLEADAALAYRLSQFEGSSSELRRTLAALQPRQVPKSAMARRAQARFNQRYQTSEDQAGDRAGLATLGKLQARLADLGWPQPRGRLILDDGGGHGLHISGFAFRFERVVFVDASAANLIVASRLADEIGVGHRVSFVRADVMRLPFTAGAFDLVHSVSVIEHVAQPAQLVAEAARVTDWRGYFLIGSPNRYPITPEPHFRIPLFGGVPREVRKRLLPLTRGVSSEDGTDPLSLRSLRALVSKHSRRYDVFFLPRRLQDTAMSTPMRRAVVHLLDSPAAGGAIHFALNQLLLPVAPQHWAVGQPQSQILEDPFALEEKL